MKKDNNRVPLKLKAWYLTMFLFAIAFEYCSYYYLSKGFNNVQTIAVTYNSKSDIDYKVYLKENNFFEEAYLPKNRTYISSLIDYIDVLFTYNLKFNQVVTGDYKYYVKGTIVAGKVDSMDDTNYWSKEYILVEPKTINFNDQDSFVVTEKIKLDYQKYNDLLSDFKKQYGLAIDGYFKLAFVVESDSGMELMTKEIPVDSTVELSIPLTQQTIELSFDTSNDDDTNTVVEEIELNSIKYKIFAGIGIVFEILDVLLITTLISNIVSILRQKSIYDKSLKKILTSYNGIIVTTYVMPKLTDLKIVYVNTFEDLIDAHSEVRMPINYIEDESGLRSDFVLINANIAWIYILKDEAYDKYVKRKEAAKKKKKNSQKVKKDKE